MKHKLGICIPYRNRKDHIDRLIPHLSKYLDEKGIDYGFYVGHQIDDKLFNRGAMKNIAAHVAFEDGCDYIAWHDVDMLPYDETCDYSYPEETPIHIATKLSKYSYSMGYEQYFGGVVLFNKEQAYNTNGYSNDYWDWGQEDDDLLWRVHYENYSDVPVNEIIEDKSYYEFNGINSYIKFPIDRTISSVLNKDHTISVLVYTEQQPDKMPIWLVGDENRKFIEYPILRKEGSFSWGISFNNSRSYNIMQFDCQNNPLYNWAKREENKWTRFTISYEESTNSLYMYLNDQMVSNNGDILRNKPILLPNKLRLQIPKGDLIMGFCPFSGTRFKGKVADLRLYDKSFKSYDEFKNSNDEMVFSHSFDNPNDNEYQGIDVKKETIKIIKSILPFRRTGSFYCLPHQDEGFVNGKWAKGETTARNEKRFVTEMQQGIIDYKEDGLKQIMDVLDVVEIDDTLYPKTKFINVKMKYERTK